MSRKYKQISGGDVLKVLILSAMDWMSVSDGVINLVSIAFSLGTSRYQVKKYMDGLVKAGVAEYKVVYIPDEYECYPPYCGYRLTDTVRCKRGDQIPDGLDRTYILQCRSAFQCAEAKHSDLMNEIFG